MFIERFGSGRQTFFGLHGWSGDHNTFAPVIRHVPKDVTFIARTCRAAGRPNRRANGP